MTKHWISLLAAAGLAVSGVALGAAPGAHEGMTKEQYKAEVDRIESTYKRDKERCDGMSGNAKDVCEKEVKGNRDVAKAEAEARQKNTAKARYDARVARADAAYEVAKEKCDDMTGNNKDVCVKEAKAKHERAKADAKVDKVAADNPGNPERVAEAKRDAAQDKRDAAYKAAVEKCDALSGGAKDACVHDAKARFGKS